VGPETRALVTGASRGIGRATAEALASRRCTLGLVARGSAELEALTTELGASGGRAFAYVADVAERDQIEAAVSRFAQEGGGIDLLVANAGIAYFSPFRELPLEQAERITRVNWMGTLYSVAAVLPHMLDRASGRIVIVSSAAAYRSFPWAAVYGASKAAQHGFLEALRHELSGTGVGITGVYPGEVDTHLHDQDRAHSRMPDWFRPRLAIPPSRVASAIVAAVERDRPDVHVPPATRVLRIVPGLSPALADSMLRVMMGRTAAPARR